MCAINAEEEEFVNLVFHKWDKLDHGEFIQGTIASLYEQIAAERSEGRSETVAVEVEVEDKHMKKEIYKTISRHHNTAVGHFGVDTTMDMLKASNVEIPHMRAKVMQFIRKCPVCQKLREQGVQQAIAPYTTSSVDGPWRSIAVDTIGPLPVSIHGCKYIIVLIDKFSRWVELVPVASTDAKSAAQAIIQQLGRYGDIVKFTSDNGPEFSNNILDEVVRILSGVEKSTTLAYSKEENGIVERANKEVMRHLRAIIFHTKVRDEWETYLPFVQRIMNTHKHSSTGVAPYQIVMPAAHFATVEIFKDAQASNASMSEYTRDLCERQQIIIDIARQSQQELNEINLDLRGPDGSITEYPVNSYVLQSYPPSRMGNLPPTKFHTLWKGPFQVVSIADDGATYTIRDLIKGKEERCHISRLKPFIYEEGVTDVREVAMADDDLFDVEAILAMQGSFNKKSDLKFKVRWVGYSEEHDTWEPWRSQDNKSFGLYNNSVLHQWMREHNYAAHIPSTYQTEADKQSKKKKQ